ncbi:MAG: hypothetical protein QXR18_10255 [Pyrobaculum sp.]
MRRLLLSTEWICLKVPPPLVKVVKYLWVVDWRGMGNCKRHWVRT